MDAYLDNITLALSGRIRPPLIYRMPYVPEFMTQYGIGELGIKFLHACESAEFREYYFNEFCVRLCWRDFIRYIIIFSEPAVFKYTIKIFHKQFEYFRIGMYYENNDTTKPVFEIANIFSANPYIERVYYRGSCAGKLNVENHDMIKILEECGFTIYTKRRNLHTEQYAELRIFND